MATPSHQDQDDSNGDEDEVELLEVLLVHQQQEHQQQQQESKTPAEVKRNANKEAKQDLAILQYTLEGDPSERNEQRDFTTGTADTIPTTDPPPLTRSNIWPMTLSTPGAVAMGGTPVQDNHEFHSQVDLESNGDADDDIESPVNAVLVEEKDIVHAEHAPEGLQALIQNKYFRCSIAAFFLALIAIIVPLMTMKKTGQVVVQEVVDPVFLFCGTYEANQADYRGTQNITENGDVCLPWKDLEGQHVSRLNYPEADLQENYCRNPNGRPRSWCYVNSTFQNGYRFCNVPYCENLQEDAQAKICGTIMGKLQSDYRGNINVTKSGLTCQRWDSQSPHSHSRTKELYPDAGLQENYCRNPDSEMRAWCYTTDPDTRWEYCDVPICELIVPDNYTAPAKEKECFNCTVQECGTPEAAQGDYRGTINTTVSGRTCQRWDSDIPHSHDMLDGKYNVDGLVENYCRNPDSEDRAWCYTTDPNIRYEYCDVPNCVQYDLRLCGRFQYKQSDYRGNVSVTESGRVCQRWDDQFPHVHFEVPHLRPEANLEDNYCRNPDTDHFDRAWCYTADPDQRTEYCDIPHCESPDVIYRQSKCATTSTQWDYRGTISVTKSGRKCKTWDDENMWGTIHTFSARYPHGGLERNYCRNPFVNELKRPQAWCYTEDPTVEWEVCDVPHCSNNAEACGSRVFKQEDYRGSMNVTESGKTCRRWDELPHLNQRTHPYSGLEKNYCRNPEEAQERAWCFTNDDETDWEFCDIPSCEDIKEEDPELMICGNIGKLQSDYRGTINVTKTGLTCQRWDSQVPHDHSATAEEYPYSGLEENYCRNPDGEAGAWCYTTDPEQRWDFCDVPICEELPAKNCGSGDKLQSDYRGTINVTKTGLTCQRWDSQEPHNHSVTAEEYPDSGLEENYCRNPDGEAGAWCYTNNSETRWDLCDVPICEE